MSKIKTKLKSGHTSFNSNEPAMFVTGTGQFTFIWVGNDSNYDKKCFGTVSGEKTLEKFAVNILKAIKSKHLK